MSNFEIVAREDFSDVTYLLEVRHPLMAKAARPGQFVIVMSHEHGERIPLTIADFDRDKGTITLVIQAVGKTTREMQQDCQVGTSLLRRRRPDGHPQPDQPREEGGVRRRRPGRGADLPAGARLQGERRLRDRRPRLPHQGPRVLGGQVPRRAATSSSSAPTTARRASRASSPTASSARIAKHPDIDESSPSARR